jgi:hypothetical protein
MITEFVQIAPAVGLIHISTTMLSDMFKEANGFRPKHYKEWWTAEELKEKYAMLQQDIDDSIKREQYAEKQAVKKFKKLIKETISYGAGDRETAIRWLVQGEGLDWNVEDLKYFFWGHGLSWVLQNRWSNALVGNPINLPVY